MAHQTGIIRYRGSFKSIRNYKNTHDPNIYAGEKGGANRDQILNSPAFARTRENMSEFKGCGKAVKAIRHGLLGLIPEHTDSHFAGRLTALVKIINLQDTAGTRGSRDICFSLNRPLLRTMTFAEKKKIDHELRKCIRASHPLTRIEATLTVNGLNPDPSLVPGNAQYYRVINHLSVIQDYVYDVEGREYRTLSSLNAKSTIVYSDYIPVNTPLLVALKAAFLEGTVLSETDTVMQCVGIEFYIRSGKDGYLPYSEGSMMVWDVF